MSPPGLSSPELLGRLTALLAELLGVAPGEIDPDRRFRDQGVDSRLALTLVARLSSLLHVSLPATAVWQHATPRALARHLGGLGPAKPAPVELLVTCKPSEEPLAIVGLGCRFPGGISSPEELWHALVSGLDAIVEVPPSRFSVEAWLDDDVEAPGKLTTRWGGFIKDVSLFDAAFFGISPREALQMDPQQRLALEVAWEAIEDARVAPGSLFESKTGVFLGAMWQEYGSLIGHDPRNIDRSSATGWDNSIIPARIAYSLGLRGPAISVNTACSSALVAVHLAAESLLRGESELALAGGVSLMLTPRATVQMTKFGAMNPRGQCRPFDAGANGYVRGEGCGVVVLRRLSDALARGERVYAVLRGSALNQDGASNGLSAPSPTAQAEVIQAAWQRAGVPTREVSYIETHGPGTILGDPIEALGLGTACREGRDAPLLIGSVKSNLGHLEAAAGVAGLMKTALALHHGELPPTLHFERPNPHIPFEELKLEVVRRRTAWPRGPRRLAGVSSFGFGGTNAHVALEAAPYRRRVLLPLAAESEDALRENARRWVAEILESTSEDHIRTKVEVPGPGPVRMVLSATHPQELEEALRSVVRQDTSPTRVRAEPRRVAFVFPGQGGQWLGMARDLWAQEPAFRSAFGLSARAIERAAGWSAVEALHALEGQSRLQETRVVQPMLFAVQVAMARTLEAYGVLPDIVLGQSMGEVAAAVVAGALSEAEGAEIICVRSALAADRASGQGGMAVVGLSALEAEDWVARTAGQVSVAVHLSPGQVVLSGAILDLDPLLEALSAEGVKVDRVAVDYASHSKEMDPLLAELEAQLSSLRPCALKVPLWSTVLDQRIQGAVLDSRYWARNLRDPVRLAPAIASLAAEAPTCFIEVGPHPAILRSLEATLKPFSESVALPAGWRDESGIQGLEDLVARLWCFGAAVDWASVLGRRSTARGELAPGAPLLLSGKNEAALLSQARRWADHLEARPEADWLGVCASAALGRTSEDLRAAIFAGSTAAGVEALRALAEGRSHSGVLVKKRPAEGELAVVFGGQGSQRSGMGRRLAAVFPAFRAALDEVNRELDAHLPEALQPIMFAEGQGAGQLRETVFAQPAIFAMEVALYRLLESFGIRPTLLLGHSVGEVTAAHVAGVLSLKDASRLVAARGRAMQACPRGGAMAAVRISLAEAEARLEATQRPVDIAGINGPRQVVLSGDREALQAFLAEAPSLLEGARWLEVSHAFHSRHIEPALDAIRSIARSCTFHPAALPIVSSLSGQAITPEALAAPEYWARQARSSVRFLDGVRSLADLGARVLVEVAARPQLLGAASSSLGPDSEVDLLGLLRAEGDEAAAFVQSLGALHLAGLSVDWRPLFEATGALLVDLPTVAFQRQRFWPSAGAAAESQAGLTPTGHPLLGAKSRVAGTAATFFTAELSAEAPAWIADHRILGHLTLPASAILELMRAAGEARGLGAAVSVRNVVLTRPLLVPGDRGIRIQVVVFDSEDADEGRQVEVYSRGPSAEDDVAAWALHARGFLRVEEEPSLARTPARPALPALEGAQDLEGLYESLAERGLSYGPSFRGLRATWPGPLGWAWVDVPAPHDVSEYGLCPTVLDAAFQAVVAASHTQAVVLPFALESLQVAKRGVSAAWVKISSLEEGPDQITASLQLFDEGGGLVADVQGLILRVADERFVRPSTSALVDSKSFVLSWEAVSGREVQGDRLAILLAEPPVDWVERVRTALEARGSRPVGLVQTVEAAVTGGFDTLLVAVPGLPFSPRAVENTVSTAVAQLQALIGLGAKLRLVWLTEGAVSVGGEGLGAGLGASGLWGLLRSARVEQPELSLQIIDLDSDALDASLRTLPGALSLTEEPELALRQGRLWAPRLIRAPRVLAEAPSENSGKVAPSGAVLVTGGLGAVGQRAAKWLVAEKGVRRLVLTSRRGAADPLAETAVAQLMALGAEVEIEAADVADEASVRALLSRILAKGPLFGVVHAAGVLDDGVLTSLDSERVSKVLAPKVAGAWHLHQLTKDLELFVLISSVAGVLGTAGQASYAAANSFLDALASHRRGLGLPGLSVSYGPWAEGGMASLLDAASEARLLRQGFGKLTPDEGVALLDRALTSGAAHVVAMSLDVGRLAEGPAGSQALVRKLLPAKKPSRAPRRLEAGAKASRPALLRMVREEIASLLGLSSFEEVSPEQPVERLGADSLMAVELRNRLSSLSPAPLPATLVFDYPTASALADYLLGQSSHGGTSVAVEARPSDEAIAIVSMACRYPGGVRSPEELWSLLLRGEDATSEVPKERWDAEAIYSADPDVPGTSYCRRGGFVGEADRFDAGFFGISAKEARSMDPQQRLLLEVAWEVLERGGLPAERMLGSQTGVFVGLMYHDYLSRLGGELSSLDGYVTTGTAGSVMSGRLSYVLGLQGPSMTVDTACSSSLVTLHLACQSLRSGECDRALAGGVTLMQTPATFVEFSRLRGLSADGRCRSYSSEADGVGWAEGCGMLLLRRLSDAERDGDAILAVIRGSSVNQDGRSQGLTAPNGPSQERVIQRALASAGLRPEDVDYVEGHGTGTKLGDPIEAGALSRVFGASRPKERPLYLGSVKSNLGHTQAAAGVAGVMKAVLALQHETLPASLHVAAGNPHIAWGESGLELVREARPWRRGGRRRVAGVSSFGISGTNAHVVLEEGPSGASAAPVALSHPVPLVLSGRSRSALEAQASRVASYLEGEPRLELVASALSLGRSAFEHRLAVLSSGDRGALISQLRSFSTGAASFGGWSGVTSSARKVAFVFTGQGSQHAGMGRGLFEAFSVFREALLEVTGHLGGWVLEALFAAGGSAGASLLHETGTAQPCLFALEVALLRLWSSLGVEPEVVLGHSLGEVTAAYAAGVLSLKDACRLVAARGRLMQALPQGVGGMVSVGAGEAEVRRAIESLDGLSIAGLNGPRSTVISGLEASLSLAVSRLQSNGFETRPLPVSHAFHSAAMEPMQAALAEVVRGLELSAPKIPMVSNLTGEVASAELLCRPEYWSELVRAPVRFLEGVHTLAAASVTTVVECGPDGTLCGLGASSWPEGSRCTWLPSLRRQGDDATSLLSSVAQLFVEGHPVAFEGIFGARPSREVSPPTYAFQRERYWPLEQARARGLSHGILEVETPLAESGGVVFSGRVSLELQPWLSDHRVFGQAVVPGAVILELALWAGRRRELTEVSELVLESPLVVPEFGSVRVQLSIDGPRPDGTQGFTVFSSVEGSEPWQRHGHGVLSRGGLVLEALEPWPPAGATELLPPGDSWYAAQSSELSYGPSFQGLSAVWRSERELWLEVRLPETAPAETLGGAVLLDAVLHPIALGLIGSAQLGAALVPFEWKGVTFAHLGKVLRARLEWSEAAAEELTVSAVLYAEDGAPVGRALALRLRRSTPSTRSVRSKGPLLRIEWSPVPPKESPSKEVGPAPAIVRWPLGEATTDLAEAARASFDRGLEVLKQWLASEAATLTPMVWVTTGAVGAKLGDRVPNLAHAALWGLGRTAQVEHPERRLVLIDLDTSDEGSLSRALELEGETQLAVREGEILAPRISEGPGSSLAVPAGATSWQLCTERKGQLDSLVLRPAEEVPLEAGLVRVEVRAAGLNFRDVLNALGMYPGEAGPLGLECAGVVVELGPGVEGLALGDRVMGLGRGTFGPRAVADARMLVRIPEALSFNAAATIPLAFLTAYYGLFDLGRVSSGDRVLIHAAAGGVGMAAVQLAQWAGAEVFGTASEGKQAFLEGLGIARERISDSRSLAFEEALLRATDGEGVDVVLNALSGAFVDASLRLLRSGGRFVEMGKTDVRSGEAVAATHPRVSYQAFDVLDAGPARIGAMLEALRGLFEAGILVPLPERTFDLRESREAFRWMAQAKHVGKLVLAPRRGLLGAGTVLVTGGLGGLGRATARHLVQRHGVRHLLLTSRRGRGTEGAEAFIAELLALGAETVEVAAKDAGDAAGMSALLQEIPASRPLSGVFHTAGVLSDALLMEETPSRAGAVLRPKVDAGWVLHTVTQSAPLEAFVLYSSVAGVWGSAGQGSYAAGNSFLDALAQHRQGLGLVGTSLAFGPWSEAGMASRLLEVQRLRLERQGLGMLSQEEGLALLDAALERPEAQLLPVHLERPALYAAGSEVRPILRGLVQERLPSRGRQRPEGSARVRGLMALPESQRLEGFIELVQGEAAQSLGLGEGASIGRERAFRDLGFDSLMSVELRNRLSSVTGASLPATLLFDHPTPLAVAELLLSRAGSEKASKPVISVERAPAQEPIAIVSMACRFPGGVESPEALWRLLEEGRDAITEVPRSRWDAEAYFDADPEAAGKSYSRWGGFLEGVERFDAGFFGISPREAKSIDPQQRLLLETSWEALERAGYRQESLKGTATGVYVGLCGTEYQRAAMQDAWAIDAYSFLGTAHSAIVGRLSYWLGLEGPNLAVDTACSSSLVAVHLAVNALRNGECKLALAGGVNLVLSPEGHVYFSRLRALSPTGRCQAFSAFADGYVRSEGCGVVVLKRLSDAKAANDRVLALIRGSAVNQDGKSNGFTAPHGPSQEAVIRSALAQGGVASESVGYVECHGTGTSLGDPIEVQALAKVYGRAGHEVRVGSVKSNLGHTEGAAGIAGLMKVVLSLGAGQIPRTLHAERLNPHIPWDELPVRVTQTSEGWPRSESPRRAGVSSFGFSGTNAHVILEEGPARQEQGPLASEVEVVPLLLSARSEAALFGQASKLLAHAGSEDVLDVARTLATRRTAFEARLAVPVPRGAALRSVLGSFVEEGRLPAGGARSQPGQAPGKVAFLFSGQGSQRPGMGRALHRRFEVFRDALEAAAAELSRGLKHPLLEVMFAPEGSEASKLLDETEYTQPALFAYEVSLYRLWASWGVVPEVLLGHSIGEVSAAHVAGVLSLSDACRLVLSRSQGMKLKAVRGGVMASLEATEAEVSAVLPAGASIAGLNGPKATVVSGDLPAVEALEAHFTRLGRRARRLLVSHAFHSAHMAPMLGSFTEALRGLRFEAPKIPVVSNVTGSLLTKEEACRPEYWATQVADTVRFMDGVRTLQREGVGLCLECGPDGTLSGLGAASWPEDGRPVTWVPSARRGGEEELALTSALCAVFAAGEAIDWPRYFGPLGGRDIDLPTYAFDRKPYWLDAPKQRSQDLASPPMGILKGPFLSAVTPLAETGGFLFTGRVNALQQPWLRDHRVFGETVVPGSLVVELALAAGRELKLDQVEGLALEAPLLLPEEGGLLLQLQVHGADVAGRRPFTLHARVEGESAPWHRHAAGSLAAFSALPLACPPWPERGAEEVDVGALTERLAGAGLEYGPAFLGLRRVVIGQNEILAEVGLPDALGLCASDTGLHPALLDAALHVLGCVPGTDVGAPQVPFLWGSVSCQKPGLSALRVRCRIEGVTGAGLRASFDLWDSAGAPVGRVTHLATRRASPVRSAIPHLYSVQWEAMTAPKTAAVEGRVLRWPRGLEPLAAVSEAKALLRPASFAVPQVWITEGAVRAQDGDRVDEVGHAALWGLARSARLELPELRLLLLDTDGTPASEAALDGVIAAALTAQQEPEVALRRGFAFAPRLRPAQRPPSRGEAVHGRLECTRPGDLDSLCFSRVQEPPNSLAEGQVRLAVRAAGLNFKDVLIALGKLEGRAFGMEAAGVVLEVGPNEPRWRPGDRVMGLVTGGMTDVVVADAKLLAPVPAGWTFAEAASVPIAFMTALYALKDLGELRREERVLIHAAAGGVGMAAVRLAQHLGAEVFATASPEKWLEVQRLGVAGDRLATSRSVELEGQIRSAAGGHGMDLILNSLSGQLVDASLRLLSPAGRFLEMGKTDLREPEAIAALHPGAQYLPFDLMAMTNERLGALLEEVAGLARQGILRPLPVTCFDLEDAAAAFRFMAQARHVGKVVLVLRPRIEAGGTALVTGGTGALAREAAKTLVEGHGVRHLVLTSRRGRAAEGAAELEAELLALGAKDVRWAALDVSQKDGVIELLESIPPEHPLTVVVHTAGVRKDATLANLTPDDLELVMRPKVDGARWLDEATRDRDLAAFIVYSSSAGTFGAAGQAGYAAANHALDALAERRHALGAAGTALAFGPWAGAGMAAGLSPAERSRLERRGIELLSVAEGRRALSIALDGLGGLLVPIHLDPRRIDGGSPLLRGVRPEKRPSAQETHDGKGAFEEVLALPKTERMTALLTLVSKEVQAVLGQAEGERLAPERSFASLGLDSLMAIELANRLSRLCATTLPATLVFDHPTLGKVAEVLAGLGKVATEEAKVDPAELSALLSRLSVEQLKESGLLEPLMKLAQTQHKSESGPRLQPKPVKARPGPTLTLEEMDAELAAILEGDE